MQLTEFAVSAYGYLPARDKISCLQLDIFYFVMLQEMQLIGCS